MSPLINEIQIAINRASRENESATPDFILAQYLFACLCAYEATVNARDKWHGTDLHDFKLGPKTICTPTTDPPPCHTS